MRNTKEKFIISSHRSFIANLNNISKDLIKAKWYFLASIATIGLGYYYILEKYIYNKAILFFIICIVGNIVFWLINEYILSHGFLFRYIQAKIAQTEKFYHQKLIKDPSNESYFFKKLNHPTKTILKIEYIIPDQFMPLYWATLWIIIINTFVASILINNRGYQIALFGFSFVLIFKIINYFTYKINKYIEDLCNFKVKVCMNNKYEDFFKGQQWDIIYRTAIIVFLLLFLFFKIIPFLIFDIEISLKYIDWLLLVSIFWYPIFGLLIHLSKLIFNFVQWGKKSPQVIVKEIDNKECYIINFKDDYLILKWIYYLFHFIL